jgi:DNA-directed RNA polymerase specialized sigma24 family protein
VQSKMTPAAFKKLQEADWKTIGIQLAAYARWKARNLHWRTGRTEDLAKGKTPEDVAVEAIEKALDGTRALNLEAHDDLLDCLKSIVDSDINHLVKSADNFRQRRPRENEDGEELHAKFEFEAAHHNYNELISQQPGDPGDHVAKLDEREAEGRIDRLLQTLADEKDLMEVLEVMLEGETKPKDIADRLKTSVSDINNRLKRIRRQALKNSISVGNEAVPRGIP